MQCIIKWSKRKFVWDEFTLELIFYLTKMYDIFEQLSNRLKYIGFAKYQMIIFLLLLLLLDIQKIDNRI